jgi:hypothetical protein
MFGYDDKLYTSFGNGSSASLLGISIYGGSGDTWWHKALIKPVWNMGHKINNLLWNFKYRFVKQHRYNIIDTGLEPGYYDIDTIMLHGMFSLLTRYVDHEHEGVLELERWGKELCDASDGMSAHSSHLQGEKELEAVALYRWWHDVRPADLKRRDELLHLLYRDRALIFEDDESTGTSTLSMKPFDADETRLHEEFKNLETKIDAEETEMLHRLIDIRNGLLT